MSEVSVALLRISHVAIQIQSQRAHGKVLKAVHLAWNSRKSACFCLLGLEVWTTMPNFSSPLNHFG